MPSPFLTPAFESFIAPARVKPQFWRLLVGFILMTMIYFGFSFGLLGAASFQGWLDGFDPAKPGNTRAELVIVLLTFLGVILGLWAALRLMHKRSFGSMIGRKGPTTRNFITAVGVFLALQSVVYLVWSYFYDGVPNLPLTSVLAFLPIAVVLVLIQTGAEEFVFRGYILQQLAVRFKSPIIWFALPPIAFGLLHYNPEMMGGLTWIAIVTICLTGLFWTDLTRITGNIGAAWGWHFINNFMLMNFLGNAGELNGFVWMTTPYAVKDLPPAFFAIDIGIAVLTWLILRRVCVIDCIPTKADIFR